MRPRTLAPRTAVPRPPLLALTQTDKSRPTRVAMAASAVGTDAETRPTCLHAPPPTLRPSLACRQVIAETNEHYKNLLSGKSEAGKLWLPKVAA